MSQETIIANTELSFKDFLFKNKKNRTILWLALAAIVIQFAVFKYFYPFANYIHGDSFSYINAADKNLLINTYLIGYSKFLRLFSVFFKSDLALVFFQYIFIQSSILTFIFSIFFFHNVNIKSQVILLTFIILNPLFLHLGNLISSDGFFLSLSMIWLTTLIWIIQRPNKAVLLIHTLIIFIAFTVRYNAIIYPLISALSLYLSRLQIKTKILAFATYMLLCGSFIFITGLQYKKLTGQWQYSPFSGWQVANNGMYAYRYVDSQSRKPVHSKYYNLDKMVREFYDSTRDIKKYPSEAILASTFYMWSKGMPLMDYKDALYKKDTISNELKKWASMGPLYKSYGIELIKMYPMHYLKYFIWPNTKKYYAPPVEFLEAYNSGKNDVTPQAKTWFGYNRSTLYTRTKNNNVWILNFYPILSGIINILMICTFICFSILKKRRFDDSFSKTIFIGIAFWLLNAAFTITASSAALRFQSVPILLTSINVILLLDWMNQYMESITKRTVTPQITDINLSDSIA